MLPKITIYDIDSFLVPHNSTVVIRQRNAGERLVKALGVEKFPLVISTTSNTFTINGFAPRSLNEPRVCPHEVPNALDPEIRLSHVNEGRCIDCDWPMAAYHYTEYGVKRVWKDGCKCADRGTPPDEVKEQLISQQGRGEA
jgi:hypothetical protein